MSRASRVALVKWMSDAECEWCLTLNPNRGLPLETELECLRLAFDDADRTLLGHRYRKKDARRRLLAFIFPEHLSSNLHFHLAVRAGYGGSKAEQRSRLEALAKAWCERVPSGTFELTEASDSAGWHRYISKEFYGEGNDFWLSSMWWREGQRKHVLDSSWRDPLLI